ncbi:hypothetical protein BT69DRAFT_1288039, partial [Atractiella rhizophila]
MLPVLSLAPLEDSFPNGKIFIFRHEGSDGRIVIGRSLGDHDTQVGIKNGWFKEGEDGENMQDENGKILDRIHAEVWSEGGKIFIKDSSSTSGTYVNERRIDQEPTELRTGDRVDFGVDLPDVKKKRFSARCQIDEWQDAEIGDEDF